MAKISLGFIGEATQPDCTKAFMIEFITTFFFVFVSIGSTMAADKLEADAFMGLFVVAMANALILPVMISTAHISGGHINPAVTLGLLVSGHITVIRSILYWIHQLQASVAACYLLHYLSGGLTIPIHKLGNGVGYTQGVVWEIVLTFSFIFTLYATMVHPKKGSIEGLGPIFIGLVVGANMLASKAFTSISMNPARSFGPAYFNGNWTNHWVYWIGPLIGGALAGFVYESFFSNRSYEPLPMDEENH